MEENEENINSTPAFSNYELYASLYLEELREKGFIVSTASERFVRNLVLEIEKAVKLKKILKNKEEEEAKVMGKVEDLGIF